jgi:hypothetical protein
MNPALKAILIGAPTAALLHTTRTRLMQWGDRFLARLRRTPASVANLNLARNLFHACNFIPLVLYHLRLSDSVPRFPHTISYSIRKGEAERVKQREGAETHPSRMNVYE